jgi:nucleotide-binding universal stress UspA family protein
MDAKIQPYRILIAEDGSEHSKAAIQLVTQLALPPQSHLIVLAVLAQPEAPNAWAMKNVLDLTCELLHDLPFEIEPLLRAGIPAKVIIEHADRYQPDFIIMGAKGLRATLGILLGGVAQQVIEYANWPVLVVRGARPNLKRALFITDGSPYSQFAQDFITGTRDRRPFPMPENVDLTVMHVLDPIFSPETISQTWPLGNRFPPAYPDPEIDRFWLQRTEKQGSELVNQTVEQLKQAGLNARGALRRGDAATQILTYVENEVIDLVISGSRGLSQVSGWLLGSVSRKIVHYAACSALVVKTPANFPAPVGS